MISLLPTDFYTITQTSNTPTVDKDSPNKVSTYVIVQKDQCTQTESISLDQYTQTDTIVIPKKNPFTQIPTRWLKNTLVVWKIWSQIQKSVLKKNPVVARLWNIFVKQFRYVAVFVVLFCVRFGKQTARGVMYMAAKLRKKLRFRPSLL